MLYTLLEEEGPLAARHCKTSSALMARDVLWPFLSRSVKSK